MDQTNDETNNANQHNMVKTPNWQGTEQMVIYKRGRWVEFGSTNKQSPALIVGLAGLQPMTLEFQVQHP